MFVFQTTMKAGSQKTADLQQAVQKITTAFKTEEGWKTISSMPRETVRAAIKSEELWHALRFPDLLGEGERSNFIKNMQKLSGTDFAGIVKDAYGDLDGRPLRLLFSDLYNSKTGPEVMEGLGRLAGIPFTGSLYGFGLMYKSLSIPDEEMRKDFAYSKYAEETITLKDLNATQLAAYRNLEGYVNTGNEKMQDAFFDYAAKNPKEAAKIVRTQDIRNLFDAALQNREGSRRCGELFVSSECKGMLSNALDYPEGINMAGYLWNTNFGRQFLFDLIARNAGDSFKPASRWTFQPPKGSPGSLAGTMLMIFDKQGKFGEKTRLPRQEEYKRIYETELAAKQNGGKTVEKKAPEKPMKSVPVLLHKKEFDAIVRVEMAELKKKYQGKTPDAEFEKIVIDSFERFYFDCNGGKAGKESRQTKEAREIIRKEYNGMQDDLKPAFLLEGTQAYLELGMEKARRKIAASGETGFF